MQRQPGGAGRLILATAQLYRRNYIFGSSAAAALGAAGSLGVTRGSSSGGRGSGSPAFVAGARGPACVPSGAPASAGPPATTTLFASDAPHSSAPWCRPRSSQGAVRWWSPEGSARSRLERPLVLWCRACTVTPPTLCVCAQEGAYFSAPSIIVISTIIINNSNVVVIQCCCRSQQPPPTQPAVVPAAMQTCGVVGD